MAGEQEVAPDAPCPGDHSVFRGRVLRGYKGGFFSNLLKGTDRPRPGSLPQAHQPTDHASHVLCGRMARPTGGQGTPVLRRRG